MMDRRLFLGAGVAGASALTFSSVFSQNTPNFGAPVLPAPGFRKMKLGAMEIIAINDGALRRPLGEEFVRNAPLEQVKAMLASQNLSTDYVDIPFTPYLIVSGNTKFLIDTGFADNGPPTTGRLTANMAAAGYKPEDIDHVVISHFHGDHINGLVKKDGTLMFPKAKVHVPTTEMAFWMDDAKMAAAPPAAQGGFQNARNVFGKIPADRLVRFEPGAELAPGIQSSAAFGHTPGMAVFTVRSEGQSFMYTADLRHGRRDGPPDASPHFRHAGEGQDGHGRFPLSVPRPRHAGSVRQRLPVQTHGLTGSPWSPAPAFAPGFFLPHR